MASKDSQPVIPGSADVDLEELKWMLIWEKHHKSIIGGAVALVVLGIVVAVVSLMRVQRAEAAAAAFASADDISEWDAVVQEFRGSVPAGNALLLIAEAQREEGKLDESTATYRRILDEYPRHPLAPEAVFGLASNLADAGEVGEAVQAYQQVASAQTSSFVAPLALYSEAHLLLAEGRQAEALPVLENLAAQYPESILASSANILAEQLRSLAPDATPLAKPTPQTVAP